MQHHRRPSAAGVLAVAYLTGAVPFTNLMARHLRGVDLRDLEQGTVSGTALHQVAGFGPLAVAGCLEVAKGAVGPLLAGRDRPLLAGVAAGAAIVGHDWSPFVGFAGGRGLSVGLGASLVLAPEATALLAGGLGLGRLAGETGLGCFAAIVALPAVLAWRRRGSGLMAGIALSVPMLAKRLSGNSPAGGVDRGSVYLCRLLYDRDARRSPEAQVQV